MAAYAESGATAEQISAAMFQVYCIDIDINSVDSMAAALEAAWHTEPQPIDDDCPVMEANKATQRTIDYITDMGKAQITAPSTLKQLHADPNREQWIAAGRKALDAIIAGGGKLVKRAYARSLGAVIAPTVTHRCVKIDQATRRLAENNAFKVRHAYDGNRASRIKAMRGIEHSTPTSSGVADDVAGRILIGDAVERQRSLTKADVGDAYTKATRLGDAEFMELPAELQMRDEDGDELCIMLTSPIWGEPSAGFEWFVELYNTLKSMGWQPCEAVPCMWRYQSGEGDAVLITIVDDLLISESKESSCAITNRTISMLKAKFGKVTHEERPTSFAGYKLTWHADGSISLSMEQKIVEAARKHIPEVIEGQEPPDILKGKALRDALDALKLPEHRPAKLDEQQKGFQACVGSLKYIEKVLMRLAVANHRCSCVMSCPPPGAYNVARSVLHDAYLNRKKAITFGRGGSHRLTARMSGNVKMSEGAPNMMECTADATWNETDRCSLYGIMLTFMGATIAHVTKKIALVCDSSMESEQVASSKATELIEYAVEVMRAIGTPIDGPVHLYTDNKANMLIANNSGSATRARHLLRRYVAMQQRIQSGVIKMLKIDDPENPSDWLTKWTTLKKVEASERYAMNTP